MVEGRVGLPLGGVGPGRGDEFPERDEVQHARVGREQVSVAAAL
jgi:hypothetical protein